MEHDDALVRPGDTAAGSPAGVGRQQAGTGGDEARSGRRDGAEGRRDAAVAPGPGASVVEWGGSDTHDPFTIVLTAAQLRRYLAYPLAVAAGVVAFVAMVREWQVIRAEGFGPVFREDESLSVGLIGSYGFGVIWMAGTLALVVALVVALFGDHGVRRVARLAGVALAATLLLTLAAAAVNFTRYSGIYGGADLRVQEGRHGGVPRRRQRGAVRGGGVGGSPRRRGRRGAGLALARPGRLDAYPADAAADRAGRRSRRGRAGRPDGHPGRAVLPRRRRLTTPPGVAGRCHPPATAADDATAAPAGATLSG